MNFLRAVIVVLLIGLSACASPPQQTTTDEPSPEVLSGETQVPPTETPATQSDPTETAGPAETEPAMTATTEPQESELSISSPAFMDGQEIPVQFTCEGEDISPRLEWRGVPEGTQSLALIVDDPDAPAGTWVHWVLYNLPPDLDGLEEAVQGVGADGISSFGRTGYGGPCPPPGSPHRYFFKLYALDASLDLSAEARKTDVEAAMQDHILAEAALMGTYSR